ncbi:MAG: hypothetical protein OXT09_19025 [Myxococcales bacterium]|nr:hypothetical protein [Myxococcales bacterium]
MSSLPACTIGGSDPFDTGPAAGHETSTAGSGGSGDTGGSPLPASGAAGSDPSPTADEGRDAPGTAPAAACSDATEGALDLIQERIFDRHACSADACHGTSAAAGLTLTRGTSHTALVGVTSTGGQLLRVDPGAADQSLLFLKLRAATEPGSVSISGSPMPAGLPPLSAVELSAIRAWIEAGAPDEGAVPAPSGMGDSEHYVADVLCESSDAIQPPVDDGPLAAPAPDEGIQFWMPSQPLAAGQEWEGCFATYYDVSDQVPEEFKSPDGKSFYVDSTTTRLARGSHHMSATLPNVTAAQLDDPAFGAWTCHGGDASGDSCDPTDLTGCGEGACVSTPMITAGCLGYGPPGTENNAAGFGLVQALTADEAVPRIPGVYREVPLKAVVFWDFHGFNLTTDDLQADGRINMTFAAERRQLERRITVSGALDGPNSVPPFKKHRLCSIWTVPHGTEILRMTSHTHQRGSNFRVWDPRGTLIYESERYAEPAYVTFDPPIRIDGLLDQERVVKFCADFNNGINADGTPNMELLSQVSKTPDYEIPIFIPPAVACSTGIWGAPCLPLLGDAQCDSTPGAGDGKCDANNIHFGLTTAGEMFYLAVDVVIPAADATQDNLSTSYVFATGLPNEVLQ